MGLLKIFLTATCFVLLVGCDDKPSTSMADAQNRKTADSEAIVPSIKIVDFVRENGWFDQGNPNAYIVRHNYSLQLTKSFGEVALDIAKSWAESDKAEQNALAVFGNTMTVQLLSAQLQASEDYEERFHAILQQCEECRNRLSSDKKNGTRLYFDTAWLWLKERGFPEAATTTETKSARQAWWTFIKTENGWMPVSN